MKHFYEFGPFRFEPKERTLLREGKPVPLSPKLIDTLGLLVENAGHLVEKDELVRRLWPDTFVEEGNLNKNIFLLRKTLGQWNGGREYIETVPKRGYRFVPLDTPAVERTLAVESRSLATVDLTARRKKSWHEKYMGYATGLIAVLLLVGLAIWRRDWNTGKDNSKTPLIKSLAVLPLENLSGDSSEDYFADGMTDELITDLSQISSLRVISRTSVLPYKKTEKPLRQIGRELDVDGVVEGTVLRSGERVRITVQLVQASSDRHLWARAYESGGKDALALQNQVASDIADEIRIRIGAAPGVIRKNTQLAKPRAYEAYLKGRYFWDERSRQGITKAFDYFNEAIREDPNFALPYAGLAEVYAALPDYMAIPPRDSYGKAETAAKEALSLDDTLAEAHTAVAGILLTNDYDWIGSEREFRRAIELNPGYSDAHHWHAINLMFVGKWEEAKAEIELARQLDPLSIIINANIGFLYYHWRRYDDAIGAERRVLELDPTSAVGHEYLGLAYLGKQNYQQAISELRQAADLSGGVPEETAELSFAYAASGNPAEARKALTKLIDQSRHEYVPAFTMAVAYTGLHDNRQAISYLQKAYEERCDLMPTIKVSPLFDSLQAEPDFQMLLKRIGFPI